MLALLEVAEGVSRVHASRRFFEYLARQEVDIPVIHHRSFEAGKPAPSPRGRDMCGVGLAVE